LLSNREEKGAVLTADVSWIFNHIRLDARQLLPGLPRRVNLRGVDARNRYLAARIVSTDHLPFRGALSGAGYYEHRPFREDETRETWGIR